MNVFHMCLMNIGALIAAAGGIFLKRLSDDLAQGELLSKMAIHPQFWLGVMCNIAPILFWLYLLQNMELTKLQPMLSVVYIYSVILALVFLHEYPSLLRCVGMALIISGVFIVGKT